MTRRAADGDRSPVGTECERMQGPDCRSHEAKLIAALERSPNALQRPGVEEDGAAVVTSDRERAAVRTERHVQHALAAAVHDADRGGAAEQRGQ